MFIALRDVQAIYSLWVFTVTVATSHEARAGLLVTQGVQVPSI